MTIVLSRETLARVFPRPNIARKGGRAKAAIWDGYAEALTSAEGQALFARFDVTTSPRMTGFLATAGVESGGLTLIWESGAYSAERIMAIFGVGRHSANVTAREARLLAGNGPALFDRVYGLGNPRKARELGNLQPGDGWRFRGCGIQQITGRRDHVTMAARIGCRVEALGEPLNSLHAALIEWEAKGCNAACDAGNWRRVRKLVNGGYNGWAQFEELVGVVPGVLPPETDTPVAVYLPHATPSATARGPGPSLPSATASPTAVGAGPDQGAGSGRAGLDARFGTAVAGVGEAVPVHGQQTTRPGPDQGVEPGSTQALATNGTGAARLGEAVRVRDQARIGARGPEIADLQARLAALGFPCGAADGRFGSETLKAVAAFQVSHGITGTGVVCAETAAALAAARPLPPRDVTADDMRSAGSLTLTISDRLRALGRWIYAALGLGAADQASGLGLIQAVTEKASDAKGLVATWQPMLAGIPTAWLFAAVALIALAWWLGRTGDTLAADRVDAARNRRNMSR